MKCIVYGLYSSRDNELRYIGQTVQPVNVRLGQYKCHCLRSRTPVHCWFKRELEIGFPPTIKIIRHDGIFNITEIEVIAEYRKNGARLLNISSGGKGVLGGRGNTGGKRPDNAARLKANPPWLGKHFSLEHRNKIGASQVGRIFSDEHRMKISAAKIGHLVSDETRAKISAKLKGIPRG